MLRYIRVWYRFLGNAVSYLFAYRADVVFKILIGAGWSLFTLAVVEAIFVHTPTLGSWSKGEVVLLLLTWTLGMEIGNTFGHYIEELDDHIVHGRLDGMMIKPMDTQFVSVFGRPDLTNAIYTLTRLIPYIVVIVKNQVDIYWTALPLYIFLLACANAIWLSIKTMLMTINFWKQKLSNLKDLQITISDFGKYPTEIFPKAMQIIFYTVLPLGFVSTVPAEVLRGNIHWSLILAGVAVTLLFVLAARLLWQKAVRQYTSASS